MTEQYYVNSVSAEHEWWLVVPTCGVRLNSESTRNQWFVIVSNWVDHNMILS